MKKNIKKDAEATKRENDMHEALGILEGYKDRLKNNDDALLHIISLAEGFESALDASKLEGRPFGKREISELILGILARLEQFDIIETKF